MKKTPTGSAVERGSRGRKRGDASFPTPPPHAGLPDEYAAVLAEIKQRIQSERLRVVMAADQPPGAIRRDITLEEAYSGFLAESGISAPRSD